MLARNFLAPADLGITDKEHAALVGLLGMLERGELTYTPVALSCNISYDQGVILLRRTAAREATRINMLDFLMEEECGTVCCLAGHCDAKYDTNFVGRLACLPEALRDLFMVGFTYRTAQRASVTADQMASTVCNYLATGEARWGEVLTPGQQGART